MRLQLFGSPAIVVGERRFAHPSKKVMALLAYLATRADEPVSRSHLAALLWGDSAEGQSRANLRQSLSQLKKLFQSAGHNPIRASSDKITFHSDGIAIELDMLFSDMPNRSVQELANMPSFLEGLSAPAPEFEDWLASKRNAIRAHLLTHLQERADKAQKAGRYVEAAEALSLALTIDPLQEALHRKMIEVLAAQGRTDEALLQYERCRGVLQRELQIEPDQETRELVSKVRAQRRSKPSSDTEAQPFNRYSAPCPALVLAKGQNGRSDVFHFEDAKIALAHGLEILRNAPDPTLVKIVVAATGDDSQASTTEARTVCDSAETGLITVLPAIYDHFKHWSPFAFSDSQTLPGGYVIRHLLSELPRHRLQVYPTVAVPQVAPTAELSVAVLPLLDRSSDAGNYNMGELLAEEVTHRLSRYRSLTVAAPSAGQSFRMMGHALAGARQMLGVNYLVDGSIIRDSERLQVQLSVTDLRVNHLVFSRRFDGAFSGFLVWQSELIDQITSAIFHKTQGAEMLRAERAPTQDSGAYDWFLRGLAAHRRSGISPDNAKNAFDYFTRAIEIDPRFARAMAWRLCAVSWFDSKYVVDPGMRQIAEALSIDEEDAEVQRIAGALQLYQGDPEQGIKHIERAVELNPSDAYLLASSAIYWAYNGEPQKGLQYIERAMLLDPFLPAWCVEDHGILLYTMSEFAKAINSLQMLTSPGPRSLAFLAASQAAAGDLAQARNTVGRIRLIASGYSIEQLFAATYFRNNQDKDALEQRLIAAGLPVQ